MLAWVRHDRRVKNKWLHGGLAGSSIVIIGIDTVFLGSGFQNGFNDWTGDLLLITQKLDQQYHPRPEEFSVPVSGMRGVDVHLDVTSVRDGDDLLIQEVFSGITSLALPAITITNTASASNVNHCRVGQIHLTGVSLYVMKSFVEKVSLSCKLSQYLRN